MSTKAYPLLFVESLSVGKRTDVTVPGPKIPQNGKTCANEYNCGGFKDNDDDDNYDYDNDNSNQDVDSVSSKSVRRSKSDNDICMLRLLIVG